MIPMLGGGFSQSGSADATANGTFGGGGGFGGINTGGQGLNAPTLVIIGVAVVLALLVLRR